MSHAVAEPGEQKLAEDDHRRGVSAKTLAAAAGAVLAIGGLGYFLGYQSASSAADESSSVAAAAAAAESDARLSEAYESCLGDDSDATLSLSDQGRTIVVDTRSEYGDTSGMQCVLSELSTPQSTIAAIGRTTSMMGVQEEDRDGITYSWTYHPDNGVDMVITLDD